MGGGVSKREIWGYEPTEFDCLRSSVSPTKSEPAPYDRRHEAKRVNQADDYDLRCILQGQ